MKSKIKDLSNSEGKVFEVIDIDKSDPRALNKLLAFGLLPGRKIELVKKKPIILVKSGLTLIALDRELAQKIYVKRIT